MLSDIIFVIATLLAIAGIFVVDRSPDRGLAMTLIGVFVALSAAGF